MPAVELAIDDPQLLRHIISTAESSKSRIGRMMETSRALMQPYFSPKKRKNFFAKSERESELQLQRETQAAWDVAATRKLQLPVLRTMAPSFTKAVDEADDGMGGVVFGEVGYKTIIGMVPTTERIKRIADDDELISSFRQYRIDLLRAARHAEATLQSVPHPDEARQMEPTLCTLASNRLIDAEAVPSDVVKKHWGVASVFAAGVANDDDIAAPQSPAKSGFEKLLARAAELRQFSPAGTSSFLTTPRAKQPTRVTGVRQPDVCHYHPKYLLTEPRVVGGYIQPRESAASQLRSLQKKSAESLETVTDAQLLQTTPDFLATESTKTRAFSTLGSKVQARPGVTSTERPSTKKKQEPNVSGDYMFVSKTPRIVASNCSAAKDLDYYPYADVRSTVKRVCCPVKFDVTLHQPRRNYSTRSQAVGIYNVSTDIANNPHRVVCMDRVTGRAGFWLGRSVAAEITPGYVDISNALRMISPRIRVAKIVSQIREEDDEKRKKKVQDPTVSIEQDLSFPRSVFDRCEAKRVRQFATMTGRKAIAPAVLHEAPESVDVTHVTKRIPNVIIHPSAPGHEPLHKLQKTEIGDVPNLKWVKPRTERTSNFGVAPSPPSLQQQPARDLWYDTSKRLLVEPRVKGNPMIEVQVSRDKRAKVFFTNGCGAHVVYNTDIPVRCRSVPLFEKQITKEAQFCGHRLQSERWQQKNPRAPGPGHYNVSYALVE